MIKITKQEANEIHEDLWAYITDDWLEDEKEHRRGSTFYVTIYYQINQNTIDYVDETFEDSSEETITKIKEFLTKNIGFWSTWNEPLTWSDDWGLDDDPETLVKVRKQKVVIEREEWVADE